ncbi:hypothetical protein CEUSTIGMA_g7971.t1 [Chlamydomonas eustigma]|uniref:NAD(P)-binding domain-containing protein n=1 Tax=Chlamydomonas eustigma TaxID=1157962 RepID=A0A250XBS8_9CHLO|nr:hypothetical protein CEUSTIGMA_g7971.t1 [Chlamydomonas eustigma]|eukprot:GAX80533.1 hypothetical protein CEUSTIGMA_g7971.t1 [Chlamydomonas eustigma]
MERHTQIPSESRFLIQKMSLSNVRLSNKSGRSICRTTARLSSHARLRVEASALVEPGSLVLVAGATGGVGQLVTAKLIERGYNVRALSRGSKGGMFGSVPNLEVVKADFRTEATIPSGLMDGVDAVCCCTGTTAFPSSRWQGDNGPRETDLIATSNLIKKTPQNVKRFIYVTSAGVERQTQLPWVILNAFGVLKYKRESEILLEGSGLNYTIFRPGRLTDGPYTSYDLNTLLKATAGDRKAVEVALTDRFSSETSRISVAEAVVQSLLIESTVGKKIAMGNVQGEGPGSDTQKWQAIFQAAKA